MGDRDAAGLLAERDFYRRLLDLGSERDLEPLLDQALQLIADVTGATMAYLELHDDDKPAPRFWRGHRCTDEDVAAIRGSSSRGIIACPRRSSRQAAGVTTRIGGSSPC
jgi:hypothetical protein